MTTTTDADRARRYRQRVREGRATTEWLIETNRLDPAMAGDAAARERARAKLVEDWVCHVAEHGFDPIGERKNG
jgi:hypothetical protein